MMEKRKTTKRLLLLYSTMLLALYVTSSHALENNIALEDLSGSSGDKILHTIEVPENASALTVTMSGGNGDADLYVRQGAAPTLQEYDCRPYENGNDESCVLDNSNADVYHIMLYAYSDFNGVSVVASFSDPNEERPEGTIIDPIVLEKGVELTDLNGAQDSLMYFVLPITGDASDLNISITGGTGDADIYVRYNETPTLQDYVCRPYEAGNEERCDVETTAAGDYHVMISGYEAYAGLSLLADYGGGDDPGNLSPLTNPSAPLAERLQIIDLEMSDPIYIDRYLGALLIPTPRSDGGVFLGWNSGPSGHITRLNESMEPDGSDWILPGDYVVEIEGLDDGGIAVLVTDYTDNLNNSFAFDRPLRLIRLDADGNQIWVTTIVGGDGIDTVRNQWYAWAPSRSANIVADGNRLLVYTMISQNISTTAGVHQGDLYAEININTGVENPDVRDWFMASHSNALHLLTSETGEGLHLTVGDAGPFGLEYNNQDTDYVQIIWPPEEQRDIGREFRSSVIDAGDLCGFNREGDTLYATVGTNRQQPYSYTDDNGDIVLLSWPVEGGEVQQTWLTNTPNEADRCPNLSPLASDHRLSVWESSEYSASMALLDRTGNVIKEAVAVDAPFDENTVITTLTNGTVMWAFAEYNDTSVKIMLVNP